LPPTRSRLIKFIPHSARCPAGSGENPALTTQSASAAHSVAAFPRKSTRPSHGSVQCAMGHDLSLYRSDAARQGSVMVLAKFFQEHALTQRVPLCFSTGSGRRHPGTAPGLASHAVSFATNPAPPGERRGLIGYFEGLIDFLWCRNATAITYRFMTIIRN